MLAPEQVTVMMRLQQLGWGTKRIARELGCDRKTVKRYLRQCIFSLISDSCVHRNRPAVFMETGQLFS